MANKTDSDSKPLRSRVRYRCRPELQAVFSLINRFPPIDERIVVEAPDPFTPLPPLQETTEDKQSRIYQSNEKWLDAGLDLLETVKSHYGDPAHEYILQKAEITRLSNLESQLAIAQQEFDDANNAYHCSRTKHRGTLAVTKKKELNVIKRELWKVGADYARSWFYRYERVKRIKTFLNRLMFIARNPDAARKTVSNLNLQELNNTLFDLYVDKKGILRKKDDALLNALVGVEIKRIRKCAKCSNFFWANRIDKQCCRTECANVHNKRESRKRLTNA